MSYTLLYGRTYWRYCQCEPVVENTIHFRVISIDTGTLSICKAYLNKYSDIRIYRVSQKKLCHGFFTITPKRKGLGSKVRPFLENSGNSAYDRH